jgi:hypothetical protein
MLVYELMEAFISVCMYAKSSLPLLKSSDPFHHVLSLDHPITDIPFQRKVPAEVPSRGGDSGSEVRLRVTVRLVITTTLMVTQVATLILVSHWGSGRACGVVVACCAASMRARPRVRGGPIFEINRREYDNNDTMVPQH